MVVTDANNISKSFTDSFTVQSNSLIVTGLDSSDADGIFGGTDSNASNSLLQNSRSTIMTVEVSNAAQLPLTYQFQIDSNKDGVFENIGPAVKSASATGTYINYNPENLTPGSYNTRVIMTDINGSSVIANDSLTIQARQWTIKGLDAVDSDYFF